MRTNEERIAVMHERAATLRKIRNMQIASMATVFVAAVLIAAFFPFDELMKQGSILSGMNASVFYESNHLVSIVIAIISFLLGVSVTIFCFYLKETYRSQER